VPAGWALLVLAFMLVAPGIFVLGPLAGLLLVARPVSRQAWLWLALAVAYSAVWLARPGELPAQFVRAFAVAATGAWLVAQVGRPGPFFPRAFPAAVTGLAVTFGWLLWLGLGWGDVEAAVSRTLSQLLLEQAHLLRRLPEAGSGVGEAMLDAAGQARWLARLFPAGLVLAALVGMALAWRAHFWLAAEPLGPGPSRFAKFTFSDHVVWLLVAGLALTIIPAEPWLEPLRVAGANVLLVAIALYVARGAAVLRAKAPLIPPVAAAVMVLILVFAFVFVAGGLMLLGLADTWLDFRRRAAPANGGVAR
jgi:hypothetical protein